MPLPTPDGPKSPTLRDLAAVLGMSKSTVSAALLGNGRIAAQTRERVMEKARELGYRPNLLMARAARRHFHHEQPALPILGMGENEPIIIGAIRQQAPAAGFNYVFEKTSGERAVRARLRRAHHTGTEAVLVIGTLGMSSAQLAAIPEWNSFVVLGAGRKPHEPGYPLETVNHDVYESVLVVWEEVRRRGYRRPGIVLFEHTPRIRDDDERWSAALTLARNEKGECPPPFIYQGKEYQQPGFGPWLKRHRPDAIISFSPASYWWLRDLGLRVPDDIGFATLHARSRVAPGEPLYSGVLLNHEVRAEKLLQLARDKILLRQRGLPAVPVCHILPTRWVDGETLRPPQC